MSRKRKRRDGSETSDRSSKRPSPESSETTLISNNPLDRSPLPCYYSNVLTLRQYFLSQLPPTSRSRRRRLLARDACARDSPLRLRAHENQAPQSTQEQEVSKLLDTAVVGCQHEACPSPVDDILVQKLERFSQTVRSTGTSSLGDSSITQSEVSEVALLVRCLLLFVSESVAPPNSFDNVCSNAPSDRRLRSAPPLFLRSSKQIQAAARSVPRLSTTRWAVLLHGRDYRGRHTWPGECAP